MMNSKFFKIFFGLCIVIIIFSIVIFIYSNNMVKKQFIDHKIKKLNDISFILEKWISPMVEDRDWDNLNSSISGISKQTGIRISIILPDGTVVAESMKYFQDMESHLNRPEIKTAFSGKMNYFIRYSSTAKDQMLYVAFPFFHSSGDNQVLAVLRLGIFLDGMYNNLTQLRDRIILITIVMLALSLLISDYISRKLNIPFLRLKDAFIRVADGDLNTRILSDKKDTQFREIAEQFNQMTEEISKYANELLSETDELNTIISAINNGIVLLNEKGKVILSNDYFKKYFASTRVLDKFYWEIIRDNRLNENVKCVIEKKRAFSTEIELSGKYYLCNGAYILKNNQSILIFQDITRSKRLDQEKRELTGNLSHELRTPLTSIKGYIETIEKADDKNRVKYIKIIKRNVDRLINMVNDLLVLSKLEQANRNLKIEDINFEVLIKDVITIFEPVIKEKRLLMNLKIDPKIPKIEADPYKIEQMMINLIENAIRYTDQGEIIISAKSTLDNKVKIEVSDTGIGMEKNELDRIFERFYVVDKSRSRHQGGTGLGLSIVKHIVMLHKGDIEVNSQPGIGTNLAIILPVFQK